MITGISTSSLFLRMPTEDAAVTVKELGAQTAEVFYQTFYEYRPEFSKMLAPKIDGLNVNSVHTLRAITATTSTNCRRICVKRCFSAHATALGSALKT